MSLGFRPSKEIQLINHSVLNAKQMTNVFQTKVSYQSAILSFKTNEFFQSEYNFFYRRHDSFINYIEIDDRKKMIFFSFYKLKESSDKRIDCSVRDHQIGRQKQAILHLHVAYLLPSCFLVHIIVRS